VGGGGGASAADSNSAIGSNSVVSGGQRNIAEGDGATVAGGIGNTAKGYYATVGGGENNLVEGKYSAILAGYGDTITAPAEYSYLFGIGSRLSEDSTFMVDLPHIRFGDETTGYEFPTTDGMNGQVMVTDGNGQLSWATNLGPSNDHWTTSGDDICSGVSGNVGIGTATPARKLHVNDVLRLEPRASAPANPSAGDMYFDSTVNKLMVYDGTTWQACF
jgi:hypothetical protein